eukprot:3659996-Rhodomonas_salina.2
MRNHWLRWNGNAGTYNGGWSSRKKRLERLELLAIWFLFWSSNDWERTAPVCNKQHRHPGALLVRHPELRRWLVRLKAKCSTYTGKASPQCCPRCKHSRRWKWCLDP